MAGMSNTEYRLNREVAQKQIESEIRYYLKNETLTFGANDAVELEKVVFDWPDYWEQNQAPSFLVVVRSLDPKLPSYKQVQNIQDTINSRLGGQYPGLQLQMQVQRINMSIVSGDKVTETTNLQQILIPGTNTKNKKIDNQIDIDPGEKQISEE